MAERQGGGTTPWAVMWLTWPLLFVLNVLTIVHTIRFGWDLSIALGALIGTIAVTLIVLEFLYPMDERWRMTWQTFAGRDIKYFAVNAATGGATSFLFGVAGIVIAEGNQGPLSDWPLWLSVPAAIVVFDFLQYWQHRWSHEADTPGKLFLWKTHAAHHLPEQVYVLMHPAGHPLNLIVIQGVLRVPLFYVLGLSPEAVFAVTAIIGLQGLIGHCNVDIRTGWFNYVFAGNELHRYHHSADVGEAKNFAVALSFIDVLFGTFVYRPGVPPARLGVAEPETYPQSRQFWRVMMLPFR